MGLFIINLFYFILLYWFYHILTWIHHGCTCVPHPEPPFHLPPHPIPLGHLSALAPSTLYHASNPDWWLISHMIIYMFQCHSPVWSCPCPLPKSPKDCSIHLCLFCCLACRVIIPIFLNSIYICVVILYWCFSFWFTSLYIIGSSFILGSLFSTGIPVPFCLSERLSKIRNWIWSSFLSNFCFCIWFGRVWNFARTL